HVIDDTPGRDGPAVRVPDRVGRARISVAGLPDAADVHDVAPAALEREIDRSGQVLGSAGAQRPGAGQMGMADEAQARGERRERVEPVLRADEIVPLVWTIGR